MRHQHNTLDETHRKHALHFQKRRETLPKKKETLANLEKTYYALLENKESMDNDRILNMKTKIEDMKNDVYDIENNITECEYYSKTMDILMDYYNILEKDINIENVENTINIDTNQTETQLKPTLGKSIKNKKKKKRQEKGDVDIISLFHPTKETEDSEDITIKKVSEKKENLEETKNKATLFENFLSVTNSRFIGLQKNTKSTNQCKYCNIERMLLYMEGFAVCENCGCAENIIVDTEKINFREQVNDKVGYPYKRINHFNEWLTQIQGKETTDIPLHVYENILSELNKNRITDLSKLSIQKMKQILKKLKYNEYYEHIPHITSRLNKKPPPKFDRLMEDKMRQMFKDIQAPFEKHRPKTRKNFLNYSYILHKFCQLLELDEFIEYFPLLKSKEKLRQQEEIWKKICEELKWSFFPSI